jgi:DNA-binding XRE family transcriptional regulator
MTKTRYQQALEERYDPVPHTAEDTARLLSDPKVKAAYDALGPKYEDLEALLLARREAGLTQAQVARRMGTTASAVARFESSLIGEKHSPTLATMRKYVTACGKTLRLSII